MQVEAQKLHSGFEPIKVSFVIEDGDTLRRVCEDFTSIGGARMDTYSNTDYLCEAIADQLRPFVED